MSFNDKCRSLYGSLKARSQEKRGKTGRITRRGYVLPFTMPEFRAWLLDQFKGRPDSVARCAYCNCLLTVLTCQPEHSMPLSRGGSPGLENLVLSCEPCNQTKGRLSDIEFRWFIERLQEMAARFGNQPVRDITSRLERSVKLAASVRYAMAKQRSAEVKKQEVNENDF